MTKISAVLTVGTDESMGYQYNFYNVIEQLSKIFDCVILVSSTRKSFNLSNYENVILLSNEKSWFSLRDGVEEFQFGKLFDNTMLGLHEASRHAEVAILLSINQYLPESQKNNLNKAAKLLVKERRPWAWMYKSYQILDRLTYPSNRLPYLINLNMISEIEMAPDSLLYKGQKVKIEDGLFLRAPFFIVDMMGDTTAKDLELKWDFYESKLFKYTYGVDRERPSWDERVAYLQHKLSNKVLWKGANVGEAITYSSALPGTAAAYFLEIPEVSPPLIAWLYVKSVRRVALKKIAKGWNVRYE